MCGEVIGHNDDTFVHNRIERGRCSDALTVQKAGRTMLKRLGDVVYWL